ncbi:MAG: 5,6-dimethylbenzimidazole synthase, partial [Candidatus Bathyarchaeia archaeon]
MDVFNAIRTRRSIRAYKPDPVSDEDIAKILDAAHWAPSAANLQPWEFIVVKNPSTRKEIQALVEENRNATIKARSEPWRSGFSKYSTEWISKAPVHIVVCANPAKTAPHVFGEETYKYATGAAIQNLMLAAHALGLGSCWLSMFDKDRLKKLLNIPKEIDVIGVVTIGYPIEVPEVPET